MPESYSRKEKLTRISAEKKLAEALGMLKSLGVSFRKQAPKGGTVVDFISDEAKLVIELDTEREPDERHARYNATRIALLEARGYRFLRYWSNDVVRNVAQITAAVIAALREQRERAREAAASASRDGDGDDAPPEDEQSGASGARDLSRRKTALLG